MSPRLIKDDGEFVLDSKAHKAIIDALRFQLSAWRAIEPGGDLDEDGFADLQNDIGYLEILLGSLEEEYRTRY